jgi:hypothetical protein
MSRHTVCRASTRSHAMSARMPFSAARSTTCLPSTHLRWARASACSATVRCRSRLVAGSAPFVTSVVIRECALLAVPPTPQELNGVVRIFLETKQAHEQPRIERELEALEHLTQTMSHFGPLVDVRHVGLSEKSPIISPGAGQNLSLERGICRTLPEHATRCITRVLPCVASRHSCRECAHRSVPTKRRVAQHTTATTAISICQGAGSAVPSQEGVACGTGEWRHSGQAAAAPGRGAAHGAARPRYHRDGPLLLEGERIARPCQGRCCWQHPPNATAPSDAVRWRARLTRMARCVSDAGIVCGIRVFLRYDVKFLRHEDAQRCVEELPNDAASHGLKAFLGCAQPQRLWLTSLAPSSVTLGRLQPSLCASSYNDHPWQRRGWGIAEVALSQEISSRARALYPKVTAWLSSLPIAKVSAGECPPPGALPFEAWCAKE